METIKPAVNVEASQESTLVARKESKVKDDLV